MRTRRSQFSSDSMSPDSAKAEGHRSVLLHEAIEQLALREDDVVVDATLGGAGHASAISEKLGARGVLIGFDLDAEAVQRATEALVGKKPAVHLIQANFRDLDRELRARGIHTITKALFDLGWSSYQLDSGRGFSFLKDEPLAMTYAKEPQKLTAATIVNEWAEESIADVLYGWGEERYSRRIAKAIVERREKRPFSTARELAECIKQSVPPNYRFGRIHPATRSFQALRIAVNDELGALTAGLKAAWALLAPGGRIAVITFHSIEDRIVKRLFAEWGTYEGERLLKKPLTPGSEELMANPRARSAKLRVIQKNFHDTNTKNKQIPPLDISGET